MERFANGDGRSALVDASHMNSYDPSAPYRSMMVPAVSQPQLPPNDPRLINEQRNDLPRRIPQFYYPRYDDADSWNGARWREQDPYLLPPVAEQQFIPYQAAEPYAAAPLYPYSSPYVTPLRTNVPAEDGRTFPPPATKSDILASHEKDADLSRLEVYHFTPKQKPVNVNGAQPIVQYHVYPPFGPNSGAAVPIQQEQQPPYAYQWYGDARHSAQPIPSFKQTKARSSQTEEPATRNRAVSPMHSSTRSPLLDDDGFPYVQQKALLPDRHSSSSSSRTRKRLYQNMERKKSTALPDCRCLDCQRERATLLNYYQQWREQSASLTCYSAAVFFFKIHFL